MREELTKDLDNLLQSKWEAGSDSGYEQGSNESESN